jgi:hypothetical protein
LKKCKWKCHWNSILSQSEWLSSKCITTNDGKAVEWVVREGVGAGGRNDPSLVCTYE